MTGSACKASLAGCKTGSQFCKTRAKPPARIRPNQHTGPGQAKLRVVDKSLTRPGCPQIRRLTVSVTETLRVVLQDRLGLAAADLQESTGGNLQGRSIPVTTSGGGR